MQTTVNMRETGHKNMTFTSAEKRISCEYIEAYQRYSNFA